MRSQYDQIGVNYAALRRPDPRIGGAILRALGDAASVVNVGGGTGAYEPNDRPAMAVEPSRTMIRQRAQGAAPAVLASGCALPFADGAFDAALAILTLHHWPDQPGGLRELHRVARRRVVILSWDPAAPAFWLDAYFPAIHAIDRRIFPPLELLRRELGRCEILELPIPHDCTDGFLGAYWRRPAAYLDARVRAAISTFTRLGDISEGLSKLQRDLRSGDWERRYAAILQAQSIDLGYRIVVAE